MRIIVSIFLLIPTLLFGQNQIKTDLEAISKKYAVQNHFTASVNYALYIDGRKDSEEKARITRKDSLFQYTLKDLEILNNGKCKLFINHISKEISVMPHEKVDNNTLFKIPLDTAILMAKSVETESISADENKIILHYDNMPYEKISIFYKKNNYTLSKIKIYFTPLHDFAEEFGIGKENANADIELEITLNTYVVNPQNDNISFSEEKYITIRGGNISLTQNYKNYELYNFLYVE